MAGLHVFLGAVALSSESARSNVDQILPVCRPRPIPRLTHPASRESHGFPVASV